jgi:hypothetical protein
MNERKDVAINRIITFVAMNYDEIVFSGQLPERLENRRFQPSQDHQDMLNGQLEVARQNFAVRYPGVAIPAYLFPQRDMAPAVPGHATPAVIAEVIAGLQARPVPQQQRPVAVRPQVQRNPSTATLGLYKRRAPEAGDPVDCAICMEEIPKAGMAKMNCNHEFCGGCIIQHFNQAVIQNKRVACCPMCRTKIRTVTAFGETHDRIYQQFATPARVVVG